MTEQRFIQALPPGAPTAEGFLLAQTWTNSIAVPFMQNLLGGLGVALLAFIGGIVSELEPLTAGKIALIIGGIVFGLAMIVRAFRDEVRFVVAVWAERHDRATQAALQQEIVKLTAEVERIKTIGQLSDQYAARDAAEQLLFDFFLRPGSKREQEITRGAWLGRGLKRADWEIGRKLLLNAGVLDEQRGMLAPSHTAAVGRLARYLVTSRSFVRAADGGFAKV